MSSYDFNFINNNYTPPQSQVQQLSSIQSRYDTINSTSSTTSKADLSKLSSEEEIVEEVLREQNIEVTKKNKAIAMALYYQGQAINEETMAYIENMMEQFKINNQLAIEAFIFLVTNTLDVTDERIQAVKEIIENKNFVTEVKDLSTKIDELNQCIDEMVESGVLENTNIEEHIITENVQETNFVNTSEVTKLVDKDITIDEQIQTVVVDKEVKVKVVNDTTFENKVIDNTFTEVDKTNQNYQIEQIVDYKGKEIVSNQDSEQKVITNQNSENNLTSNVDLTEKQNKFSQELSKDVILKTDSTFKVEQKLDYKKINSEISQLLGSKSISTINTSNNLNVLNSFNLNNEEEFFQGVQTSESEVRNAGISDEALEILQEYKQSKSETPKIVLIDNEPVVIINSENKPKIINLLNSKDNQDKYFETDSQSINLDISEKAVNPEVSNTIKQSTSQQNNIIGNSDSEPKSIINTNEPQQEPLLNNKLPQLINLDGKLRLITIDKTDIKILEVELNIKEDIINLINPKPAQKAIVNGKEVIVFADKQNKSQDIGKPININPNDNFKEQISGKISLQTNDSGEKFIVLKNDLNEKNTYIRVNNNDLKDIDKSPVLIKPDSQTTDTKVLLKVDSSLKEFTFNKENIAQKTNLPNPEVINITNKNNANQVVLKDINGNLITIPLSNDLLTSNKLGNKESNLENKLVIQDNKLSFTVKDINSNLKLLPLKDFIQKAVTNSPVQNNVDPVSARANLVNNIYVKVINNKTVITVNNQQLPTLDKLQFPPNAEKINETPQLVNIDNKPQIIVKDGNSLKITPINLNAVKELTNNQNVIPEKIVTIDSQPQVVVNTNDGKSINIPLNKVIEQNSKNTDAPIAIIKENQASLVAKDPSDNQFKIIPANYLINNSTAKISNENKSIISDIKLSNPINEIDNVSKPTLLGNLDSKNISIKSDINGTKIVINTPENELTIPFDSENKNQSENIEIAPLVINNKTQLVFRENNNVKSVELNSENTKLPETDIKNIEVLNSNGKNIFVTKGIDGNYKSVNLNENIFVKANNLNLDKPFISEINNIPVVVFKTSDNQAKIIQISSLLNESNNELSSLDINDRQRINPELKIVNDKTVINSNNQELVSLDNLDFPQNAEKINETPQLVNIDNQPQVIVKDGKSLKITPINLNAVKELSNNKNVNLEKIINIDFIPQLIIKNNEGKSFAIPLNKVVASNSKNTEKPVTINKDNHNAIVAKDPFDNEFKIIPTSYLINKSLADPVREEPEKNILNQFKNELESFENNLETQNPSALIANQELSLDNDLAKVPDIQIQDFSQTPKRNENGQKLKEVINENLKVDEPVLFNLNGKQVLLTKTKDDKVSVINIDNSNAKPLEQPIKVKINNQSFFVVQSENKNILIPSLKVNNSVFDDINKTFKVNINGKESIVLHDLSNKDKSNFITLDPEKIRNFRPEPGITHLENNQGKPAILINKTNFSQAIINLPEHQNENFHDLVQPLISDNKLIFKDSKNTLLSFDLKDLSKNSININKNFVSDIAGNKSIILKNYDNNFVQFKLNPEIFTSENANEPKTLNINGKPNLVFSDKKSDSVRTISIDDISTKLANTNKVDKPFVAQLQNQKLLVFTDTTGELRAIPFDNALANQNIKLEKPVIANINGKESLIIGDEKSSSVKVIPVSPVNNKNFEKTVNPVQANIDGKQSLIINNNGINKIISSEDLFKTNIESVDTKLKVKIDGKTFFVIPEKSGEHIIMPEKAGITRDLPDLSQPLKVDIEGKSRFLIKDNNNKLRIFSENDLNKITNYSDLTEPVFAQTDNNKIVLFSRGKDIIKINLDDNLLKNSSDLKNPVEINLNNEKHLIINDNGNKLIKPDSILSKTFNSEGKNMIVNIDDKEHLVLANQNPKNTKIIPLDLIAKNAKPLEDLQEINTGSEQLVLIKGNEGKFILKPKSEILDHSDKIEQPIQINYAKKDSIVIPDKSGLNIVSIPEISKKSSNITSPVLNENKDGSIQIIIPDKTTGKHKVFNLDKKQFNQLAQISQNQTFISRATDKNNLIIPEDGKFKFISFNPKDLNNQNIIKENIKLNNTQSIVIENKKPVFIDLNKIPENEKISFDKPLSVSIEGKNYLLINNPENNSLKILPFDLNSKNIEELDFNNIESLNILETEPQPSQNPVIAEKPEINLTNDTPINNLQNVRNNNSQHEINQKIQTGFKTSVNNLANESLNTSPTQNLMPDTFEKKVVLLKQMLGIPDLSVKETDNKNQIKDTSEILEDSGNDSTGLLEQLIPGQVKSSKSASPEKSSFSEDMKVSFDSLLNSILSDPKSKDLIVENISDIVFFKQVFEEEKLLMKNPENNELGLLTVNPEEKKPYKQKSDVVIAETMSGQMALLFNDNKDFKPKLIKLDAEDNQLKDFDEPVKSDDGRIVFSDKQTGQLKSFNSNSMLQVNPNKLPKNFVSQKDNMLIIKNDNQFLEVDINNDLATNYFEQPKMFNINGKNSILINNQKDNSINVIHTDSKQKETVSEPVQINFEGKQSLIFNQKGINKLVNLDNIPDKFLKEITKDSNISVNNSKISLSPDKKTAIIIDPVKNTSVSYNFEQPLKVNINNSSGFIIKDKDGLKFINENDFKNITAETLKDPVEANISGDKFVLFNDKNSLSKIKLDKNSLNNQLNLDEPLEIDNKFILVSHNPQKATNNFKSTLSPANKEISEEVSKNEIFENNSEPDPQANLKTDKRNFIFEKSGLLKKSHGLKEPVNLRIDKNDYMAIPHGKSIKVVDYKNISNKSENVTSPVFIHNKDVSDTNKPETKVIIQNNQDKAKVVNLSSELLENKESLHETVLIKSENNTKIVIPENEDFKELNIDNKRLSQIKSIDKPVTINSNGKEKIVFNNNGENIVIDINKLKNFDNIYKSNENLEAITPAIDNVKHPEKILVENVLKNIASKGLPENIFANLKIENIDNLSTEQRVNIVRQVLESNKELVSNFSDKDEIPEQEVNANTSESEGLIEQIIPSKSEKPVKNIKSEIDAKVSFDSILNSVLSDPKAKNMIVDSISSLSFFKGVLEPEEENTEQQTDNLTMPKNDKTDNKINYKQPDKSFANSSIKEQVKLAVKMLENNNLIPDNLFINENTISGKVDSKEQKQQGVPDKPFTSQLENESTLNILLDSVLADPVFNQLFTENTNEKQTTFNPVKNLEKLEVQDLNDNSEKLPVNKFPDNENIVFKPDLIQRPVKSINDKVNNIKPIVAKNIVSFDINGIKKHLDLSNISINTLKSITTGTKVLYANKLNTVIFDKKNDSFNLIDDKSSKVVFKDIPQPIKVKVENREGYLFRVDNQLKFISSSDLNKANVKEPNDNQTDISGLATEDDSFKISSQPKIINYKGQEKLSVNKNNQEVLVDLDKLRNFEELYNTFVSDNNVKSSMDIISQSEITSYPENNQVLEQKVNLIRQILGVNQSQIKETSLKEKDPDKTINDSDDSSDSSQGLLGSIIKSDKPVKNVSSNNTKITDDMKVSFDSLLNSILSDPKAKDLVVESINDVEFFKQQFEEEKVLIKDPESEQYNVFDIKSDGKKINDFITQNNGFKVNVTQADKTSNINTPRDTFDKNINPEKQQVDKPIKVNHNGKDKLMVNNNGKSMFIDLEKLKNMNYQEMINKAQIDNKPINEGKNQTISKMSSNEINIIQNDANKMNNVLKNFLEADVLNSPQNFSQQINMMSQIFGVFENQVKTLKTELEPFKNDDNEENLENPFEGIISTKPKNIEKDTNVKHKKDPHHLKVSFEKLLSSVLSDISSRIEKIGLNFQGREILSNNEKCFCIPLSIPYGELRFNGEILIKEEKNRDTKRSGGKVLSITLSVETKNLNTVLIDLVNMDKDLQISLKVDNKKIKDIFDQKISFLNELMTDSIYKVKPITCMVNPNKNRGNSLLVPRNIFPKSLKRIDGVV